MALKSWFQHDGYRPAETEDSMWLRLLVFLTICVAILATVFATESGYSIAVVSIGLTGLGSWISWRRRRAKNWWIKLILAMAMLVALANFLYEIADNPFDARIPLAHLLIWLQVLHSFDLPRRKDVFYSQWVALILISVAATTSRSSDFGVFLLLYACLSVSGLLASHLSSQGQQRVSLSYWGRFSLPIVMFTLVTTAIGFVLIPRYEGMKIQTFPVSVQIRNLPLFNGEIKNSAYPNRSSPNDPAGQQQKRKRGEFDPYAYYGFSTELDLNYRGKLADEIIMRVRSPMASYWRGMAFDTYDGLGWSMQDPFKLQTYSNSRSPIWIRETQLETQNIVHKERVTQTYYIERDQSNLIFKSPYVDLIYFPTTYVMMDTYGSLRSPIELLAGTAYTTISQVPQFSPQALKRVSWESVRNSPAENKYYTLPAALPPRIKQLTQQITKQAAGPFEAVLALEAHLKQKYPYNLEIPEFPENRDTIDYFLFEQREGYCEHFASSLAIMARQLGLASRLVTGYVPGKYNPMTGYFEVKSSDAHGWVEVYFPHHGWVPFDPTPGYLANLNQPRTTERNNAFHFLDYFTSLIPSHWKAFFSQAWQMLIGGLAGLLGFFAGLLLWIPLPLLALGAILISVLVLLWVGLKARGQQPAESISRPRFASEPEKQRYVQQFLIFWQQFAEAKGQPYYFELTPQEHFQQLQPLCSPAEVSLLSEALAVYYETRYAGQPVQLERITQVMPQLQAALNALAKEPV